MLKRIAYGAVIWVVPFIAAIPLLSLNQNDPFVFKTLMVLVGALVGGLATAHYFLSVERDFLREAVLVTAVWLGINWLLDLVALLPFTGQSIDRYFLETGLRYLALAATILVLGFVLGRKLEASPKA